MSDTSALRAPPSEGLRPTKPGPAFSAVGLTGGDRAVARGGSPGDSPPQVDRAVSIGHAGLRTTGSLADAGPTTESRPHRGRCRPPGRAGKHPPSTTALLFALRRLQRRRGHRAGGRRPLVAESEPALVVLVTRPEPGQVLGGAWSRLLGDPARVRAIVVDNATFHCTVRCPKRARSTPFGITWYPPRGRMPAASPLPAQTPRR